MTRGAASGGRLDLDRAADLGSARACMIRMPKCGSSSVHGGDAVTPVFDLDAELPRARSQPDGYILRSSGVLRGVRERLAGDVLGGVEHRGRHVVDVALDRRPCREPPACGEVARRTRRGWVPDATRPSWISKSTSRMSARSSRICVFDLVQLGDGAGGVGLDPVAQRLELQHGQVTDWVRPSWICIAQRVRSSSISDSTGVATVGDAPVAARCGCSLGRLTLGLVPSGRGRSVLVPIRSKTCVA